MSTEPYSGPLDHFSDNIDDAADNFHTIGAKDEDGSITEPENKA